MWVHGGHDIWKNAHLPRLSSFGFCGLHMYVFPTGLAFMPQGWLLSQAGMKAGDSGSQEDHGALIFSLAFPRNMAVVGGALSPTTGISVLHL